MSPILARSVPLDWATALGDVAFIAALLAIAVGAILWFAIRNRRK